MYVAYWKVDAPWTVINSGAPIPRYFETALDNSHGYTLNPTRLIVYSGDATVYTHLKRVYIRNLYTGRTVLFKGHLEDYIAYRENLVGRDTGNSDLMIVNAKTLSIKRLKLTTGNEGKLKPFPFAIWLNPSYLSDNRIFFLLNMDTVKVGNCGIYGVLSLTTYLLHWDGNSCIEDNTAKSLRGQYTGNGNVYSNGDYIGAIPDWANEAPYIYDGGTGQTQNWTDGEKNKTFHFILKPYNTSTGADYIVENYSGSDCHALSGFQIQKLADYMRNKSNEYHLVKAFKCRDVYSVLWSTDLPKKYREYADHYMYSVIYDLKN
ncbi:hypothetical protein [Deinococcus sonorensis]|uniref:Uncharacterized protein n=1 Tax=Deinococcus sonorensis TaxID=309891 RepID=A0ABV8YBK6_9DEIO